MNRIFGLAMMAVFVLGCNFSSSNNANNSNNSNNASSAGAKSKGDFSTPKAAVETFIKAGTARDVELLNQCFDAGSPGEFRRFRDKTATAKDLDEMAEFTQGAQVGEATESGDEAVVSVKFKQRDEKIKMKRSDGNWRILDF